MLIEIATTPAILSLVDFLFRLFSSPIAVAEDSFKSRYDALGAALRRARARARLASALVYADVTVDAAAQFDGIADLRGPQSSLRQVVLDSQEGDTVG